MLIAHRVSHVQCLSESTKDRELPSVLHPLAWQAFGALDAFLVPFSDIRFVIYQIIAVRRINGRMMRCYNGHRISGSLVDGVNRAQGSKLRLSAPHSLPRRSRRHACSICPHDEANACLSFGVIATARQASCPRHQNARVASSHY